MDDDEGEYESDYDEYDQPRVGYLGGRDAVLARYQVGWLLLLSRHCVLLLSTARRESSAHAFLSRALSVGAGRARARWR